MLKLVLTVFVLEFTGMLQNAEQSIWELPTIPEAEINLGFWALVIAKEYDPSVDVNHSLQNLDFIAETIINGLPPNDHSSLAKISLAQIVLYRPGYWNQEKVFSYDFSDPDWEKESNFLLSNILKTKMGNCISLPVLFLAVMERVDEKIQVSAVRAPFHLFCRFRDKQSGLVLNIETTSGELFEGDEAFFQDFPPSPQALASGYQFKDLTKKELLADLVGLLIKKERNSGNLDGGLAYAELALKIDPESVTGFLGKGSILINMGLELVKRVTNEKRQFTRAEYQRALDLKKESDSYIEKAFARGWRPFSQEDRAKYLKSIQKFRD